MGFFFSLGDFEFSLWIVELEIYLRINKVCEDADPMDFHMPGYTFLSAFFPHRGLAIYISNDIVYQCQQHLFTSDAEFSEFSKGFNL